MKMQVLNPDARSVRLPLQGKPKSRSRSSQDHFQAFAPFETFKPSDPPLHPLRQSRHSSHEKQEQYNHPYEAKNLAQSLFCEQRDFVRMKQSYVTVHDKQKQRIQKRMMESQLFKVEQTNVKKVKEMHMAKQHNKQGAVNLIKITNHQEDYKSVKMETRGKSAIGKISVRSKEQFEETKRQASTVKKAEQRLQAGIGSIVQKNLALDQQKENTTNIIVQTYQHKPKDSPKEIQQFHRGMTNSFFYGLHTKIDELDLMRKNILPEEKNNYHRSMPYRETEAMINTKNLLKELNEQLGSLENQSQKLEEVQQDKVMVEQPHHIINEIFIDQSLYESDVESRSPSLQQSSRKQSSNPASPARVPQLKFRSSLIDLQVVQSAPKSVDNSNIRQKIILQDEIGLLKQVINELKVERIRYQESLQSEKVPRWESQASSFNHEPVQQQYTPNRNRQEIHRPTKSGAFAQSIVSPFNPKHYRSQTTLSGKIIKNFSPNRMSPVVAERSSPRKQEEFIRQQVEQTEIKDEMRPKGSNKPKEVVQLKEVLQPKEDSKSREQCKHKQSSASKMQPNSQSLHFQANQKLMMNNFSQGAKPSMQQQKPNPTLKNSSFVIPLVNHSINCQSDIGNFSKVNLSKAEKQQPSNFINESRIRQKLLNNFEQMERVSEQSRKQKEQSNAKSKLKESNIKSKLLQSDLWTKGKNSIISQPKASNQMKSSRSTKGFRIRQSPEIMKNSKMMEKSIKSNNSNLLIKKQENAVYLPPQSQLFSPQQSNEQQKQLYEIQFTSKDAKEADKIEGFTVPHRNIVFNLTNMPLIPSPPNPNTTLLELCQAIKQLSQTLSLDILEEELPSLIMKKYKNSLMIDLPSRQKIKLIWYYSGKLYVGEWNDSAMIKSGQGFEYIPGKYCYRGQFLHDKRNGSGSMASVQGNHYEGQWFQGQRDGRGKYSDKTAKLSYEGEWKNGKRHGYGYLRVEGQSVFQGTFSENFKNGFGTECFPSGDSYRGQFSRGRFHGNGKYIWASGDSYQGNFYEGCRHGKGKLLLKGGETYAGHFSQDQKSGKGRYMWQNGCIYQGDFSNDCKNGQGSLIYPDGRQVRGTWKDDQMIQFQVDFPRQQPQAEVITRLQVSQPRPKGINSANRMSGLS